MKIKSLLPTKNLNNLCFGNIALTDLPFTDWINSKIRPIFILKKDKDNLLVKISSKINIMFFILL